MAKMKRKAKDPNEAEDTLARLLTGGLPAPSAMSSMASLCTPGARCPGSCWWLHMEVLVRTYNSAFICRHLHNSPLSAKSTGDCRQVAVQQG